MDVDVLLRLFRELHQRQVAYVLVGGVALGILGLVRATEDVDLFVKPDEENIRRLREALGAVWNDPEIEKISASDLAGEYPVVRYGPPDGDLAVDILASLGTSWRFEDIEALVVFWEGVPVRVATPQTMYRMKKATSRPIDQADALALKEKFGLEDDAG
ncbi:hypothetical protein HRbin09_00875 [bacterium HR09]|nr:hypothetical protein HRbin09_00875 [bacterium HR09]